MKPKSNDEFVPRALQEVWEWKDSIYQEVKHLPVEKALHEIMRMAHEAAVAQGAVPATPAGVTEATSARRRPAKVAESPTPYRTKRPRKKMP